MRVAHPIPSQDYLTKIIKMLLCSKVIDTSCRGISNPKLKFNFSTGAHMEELQERCGYAKSLTPLGVLQEANDKKGYNDNTTLYTITLLPS